MNFTRIFTILSQNKGLKGVYSIGRVQTPCNALVVENDLAIKNFKPETFFKLYGSVKKENQDVRFSNTTKYDSKEKIQEAIQQYGLGNTLETTIQSVKKEQKSRKAPKLYNLGGIQSYANKKWKYSLDKTLKIVQSLYQKGFLSYPRTDCDLITTNEFEYLKENLDSYMNVANLSFKKANLEPRKEYVNNEKVLEHYALVPTVNIPNVPELSKDEQNIYLAVVRNTVLMFGEDYLYESTIVTIDVNGMKFQAKGNVPIQFGWTKVEEMEENSEDEDEGRLPSFSEGETLHFTPKVEEGVTKEPARLTEAKLGGKGGTMDKLNLGTPATRSGIIKTLIDREYVRVEKTKLYPTEKGIMLYENTKDTLLGKPEMTQKWEEALAKIGKDRMNPESGQQKFLENIHLFCTKTSESLKKQDITDEQIAQIKKDGEKRIGTYIVKETSKAYNVSNEQGSITIWKTIAGKKLTAAQLKQLLEKGKTNLIKGFKSKADKSFDAHLVLKDNKVQFEFAKKK